MFVAPALSLTMAIMDERDPEVSRSPSPRISRTSTSSSLVLSLSPSRYSECDSALESGLGSLEFQFRNELNSLNYNSVQIEHLFLNDFNDQ